VRKQLRRSQAIALFKALPPCLIGKDDILAASRRFRGIPDIDRFSSLNDL
jgi:hypothetical protein